MLCLWTNRSFWPALPNGQCYSCDEFSHFTQHCPNKISPSRTPCHQDRSCSRHQYTHSQRHRSHSTQYGHRNCRHFNQLQSHCHPHYNRSSSSSKRHISHSSSNHWSGSCHPLANRCPHHHSCHDASNRHSHPHPTIATSSAEVTHATIPQTGAGLIPATPTALHRRNSQWGKPRHTQDLQPSIDPIVTRLSSSKTPQKSLPQIQTVTLIL